MTNIKKLSQRLGVYIQDQFTEIVDVYFCSTIATTTLATTTIQATRNHSIA